MLVLACGGEPTGPSAGGSEDVQVFWPASTDTVDAATRLVVRVASPGGDPMVGVSVRVRATWMEAGRAGHPIAMAPDGFIPGLTPELSLITGPAGRTSVSMIMGTVPGEAAIEVLASTVSFVDTLRVTILPGAATDIVMIPSDTAVFEDGSFPYSVGTVDRHGNPRSTDQVDLQSASARIEVDVDASTVAGLTPGPASVEWSSGAVTREFDVVVVPRGALAMSQGFNYVDRPRETAVMAMNLDGSRFVEVFRRLDNGGVPSLPAWSGDGRLAYVDYTGLYVDDLTGSPVEIAQDATTRSLLSWTADGQWVYYTKGRSTWRAATDGSGTELVVSAPGRVSPDGRMVAVNRGDELWLHEIETGLEILLLADAGQPAWSSDSTLIWAAVDGGSSIVETDGSIHRQMNYPPQANGPWGTSAFAGNDEYLIAFIGEFWLIHLESGIASPLPVGPSAVAEPTYGVAVIG